MFLMVRINVIEFWNTLKEHQQTSLLQNVPECTMYVSAILSFFWSTYLCEATYSELILIKNKYRMSYVHFGPLFIAVLNIKNTCIRQKDRIKTLNLKINNFDVIF